MNPNGYKFLCRPDLPTLPRMETHGDDVFWCDTNTKVDWTWLIAQGYVEPLYPCPTCGQPTEKK